MSNVYLFRTMRRLHRVSRAGGVAACLLGVLTVVGVPAGARGAERTLLSENSHWHSYVDFATDQIDPESGRRMLDDLLSERGQERLADEVTENARWMGVDVEARAYDWRNHLYLRWEPFVSSYFTVPPPAPPSHWMQPDFDPAAFGWVLRNRPIQFGDYGRCHVSTLHPATAMVRASYHRASFQLEEPRPLRLDLRYRGGVRIFVNGREVLRRHLPEDRLADQARAAGYDRHIDPEFKGRNRFDVGQWLARSVEGFEIPAEHLRAGRNVLAVENRAPYIHPAALAANRQHGLGGQRRTDDFEVLPPHTGILSLRLRGSGSKPRGEYAPWVWAGDIHRRYNDRSSPPEGEEQAGAIRLVGARNGVVAGVLLLRASQDGLEDVTIQAGALAGRGGETIVAEAFRFGGMLGRELTSSKFFYLGDHRGNSSMGAQGGSNQFPQIGELWRWGHRASLFYHENRWRLQDLPDRPDTPTVFYDEIGDRVPAEIPANHTVPVWVWVRVPAGAAPGVYRGKVTVTAAGQVPAEIPVLLRVEAFDLPAPADFAADVWIEQAPYGLAHTAGVELWSEAHWDLIRQSLSHLGRIGADVVHIPVLQFTEFGNESDAMVRWSGDPATENVRLDFSLMNRYLDLVADTLGKPRAVSLVVMQGGGLDQRLGGGRFQMDESNTVLFTDRDEGVDLLEHRHLYGILARHAVEQFRRRGWEDVLHWGHYWDHPPQGWLIDAMAQHAPDVYWIRSGHIAGGIHQRVRAQSEIFPSGWDRPDGAVHALNPRAHCHYHFLEGYFPPFSFRLLPERAMYTRYTGFGRMGADFGRSWGRGVNVRGGVADFGTKNLLWVRNGRVHTSQRFEVLREAVQEAEVIAFLQRARASGRLDQGRTARIQELLDRRIGETSYVPAYFFHFNSWIQHDHPQRWQQRSIALYRMAAEIAASGAMR